jgi:tricorn protease
MNRTTLRRTPRWCAGLAVLFLGLLAAPVAAAEVKLARHPDYHNGKIVFSYLGDLWMVNEDGSSPQRLTVNRARDVFPRFSPDGKWIAFSSDRYGNNDVFVMPAQGGKAKQLTFNSAGDTVVGWTRDSKRVVFTSARGLLYPGIPNLYEVPVGGGLEQPVLTDWGSWGSYSPDGKRFAFNRHPMSWWRKHYRGSYAADLWVLEVDRNRFTRLLDDKLSDDQKPNNLWPMYANGEIYFVSDRGVMAKAGSPEVMKSVNNIWKISDEGGKAAQVTRHTSGALFYPSLSADGKVIVYEENFGIWKLEVATGKTSEVKIDITTDDADNNLETLVSNSEADTYHLSPSGKRAVISIHGELFSIATDKGDLRRLTQTPGVRETGPQWSPDGKLIAFVSDKSGEEEIWVCDELGGNLRQISSGATYKGQIRWSPDGKSLLYTAGDNKLYRYNFETKKTTVVATSEVVGFGQFAIGNPQWSPDGKWVSYSKSDRTLLPQVWVVPADGGQEKRITDPDTYSSTSAVWTPDGKRIVFIAGEDVGNIGQRGTSTAQLYSVSLQPETSDSAGKGIDSEEEAQKAEKTKPGKGGVQPAPVEVKIDFERIGRRTRQLTRTGDTITALAVAPNGQTVLFATTGVEGGRPVQSLWSMSIEGERLTRLAQGVIATGDAEGPPQRRGFGGGGGFSALQVTRDGRSVFYKQGKGIYSLTLGAGEGTGGGGFGGGKGGKGATAAQDGAATPGKRVTFTARVEVDQQAQRKQVFAEAWRVMRDRFYDPNLHGVNWIKVRQTYEPLLAHVANQEDLHDVVSLMLGELNASHTGISGGRGQRETAAVQTRYPGFELAPDPSGYYKVTHIYRNGPADKDYVKLNVGDFILAVDGIVLKSGDNYWQFFTKAPATRLEFTVNSKPATDGAWKIKVTPVSSQQYGTLQYEKWVAERKATVERLSGGDIGYLHIRQMSEPNLRKFERDLATLHTKKALIIDQRFNPGGNIDQELLQILGQRQYQYTRFRNSTEVTRPLKGFFGPMVVMANERSTSDAEVFPDGFRTLKLGKVVGVTTYGAVIGTGAYQLMDGSTIRTPATGLWSVGGVNLENYGVPPDEYIDNTPEDFFRGRDAQLERAVEVLRQELAKRK